MPANNRGRMPLIDALKALCCLLIVMHHLAIYGPMPEFAYPLIPGLIDWLGEYGRIAVQLFFVSAGFLCAAKYAPQGLAQVTNPIPHIRRRYLRLITPYLAVLILAIVSAAVARIWMQNESIPGVPNLFQLFAHIFLLHNLLNQEVLSAGIWYVAIDFQLFALTVMVLWTANRMQDRFPDLKMLALILIFGLTTVSLFFFNRDSHWDNTALYFFGSYGMGALVYWAAVSEYRVLGFFVLIAVIVAALTVEFRSRIAVAGSVMLLLGAAQHFGFLYSQRMPGWLTYLGRASYSIFLIHFPVLLIVNAAFFKFLPHQSGIQLAGLLLALSLSTGAGVAVFSWLEVRPVSNRVRILLPVGFVTSGVLAMFAGG
ncbi:MAG: acyltransferase [Betaproteobacteria bacterium]|nr:acyltransferase [Betaproteobacteria bacterium]